MTNSAGGGRGSETSADDADHLLDLAMAGLLRDETER